MTPERVSAYKDNLIEGCVSAVRAGGTTAAPPSIIYHLTDGDSLLSIVRNRCLWASLATTLNDSLEVRYGLDLAVAVLQERIKRGTTWYDSFLLEYLLDSSVPPKQAQAELAPYVVSFCGRPGKSGQWLHYGRSGHGVALGFSSSIAPAVHYDLFRVDYTRQSQEESMLRLFQVGASALEAGGTHLTAEEQTSTARMTAYFVSMYTRMLAVVLKHPSFEDEDEWRMVAHDISRNGQSLTKVTRNGPVKFRMSGERIIPYEELNFGAGGAGLLKEVILGHASALSADAVRLLAVDNGDDVVVTRSEVPVR